MYIVDSNILIEAKNRYYSFDIVPGFWTWLERSHKQGMVCSIDKVQKELLDGENELAEWADSHKEFFHSTTDQATLDCFSPLTDWACRQKYTRTALNDFTANTADYVLVAYACAHKYIVVTHETSAINSRKRIKIPDACDALNVNYVDTFKMLRNTNTKFDLL